MALRSLAVVRTKRCPQCEQTKTISSFGRNRQAKDGLHYYCKECAAQRQRQWARNNPETVRSMRASYLDRIRDANSERNPYE